MMHEVTERLYKTEAGEIVPAGHPESRWLFAVPGSKIGMAEAVELGLVSDDAPTPEAEEPKPKTVKIGGKAKRGKGNG
jgi:hypothetical protein